MRIQFVFFQQQNGTATGKAPTPAINDEDDDERFSFSKAYPADHYSNNDDDQLFASDDDSSTTSETTKGSSVSSMTMSTIESLDNEEMVRKDYPHQHTTSMVKEIEGKPTESCRVRLPACGPSSSNSLSAPPTRICFPHHLGLATALDTTATYTLSSDTSCCSCPEFQTKRTKNMSFAAYKVYIQTFALTFGNEDHPLVARTWNLLGMALFTARNAAAAVKAYQMSILHDEQGGRPLADTYRKLGQAYMELRDYRSAVAFLEQALQILQSLSSGTTTKKHSTAAIAAIEHSMGMSFWHMEQWHKALEYLEASVSKRSIDPEDKRVNDAEDTMMEALYAMTKMHCEVTGNLVAARKYYRIAKEEQHCGNNESKHLRLQEMEAMIRGSSPFMLHNTRRLWCRKLSLKR